MERNGVLDIFHPCQELNQSLEAEPEASRVSRPLPPELQIPVQTMAGPTQPLLEDVRPRLPETSPTELPHAPHQEVDTTDQAWLTGHLPHVERLDVLRPVDEGHRTTSGVVTQPLLVFPAQVPLLQGAQRGLS